MVSETKGAHPWFQHTADTVRDGSTERQVRLEEKQGPSEETQTLGVSSGESAGGN